jgi:uncharacterized phage protein gp47/JayE
LTIPQKLVGGFVSDSIATWSAETNTSQTFTDGDPLLAFWQSIAVQLDFLQAQVQMVLAMARAQTSTGADLDSWMAQFGFYRLPAVYASGQELFQRLNPSSSDINVPPGVIVQTVGGGIQYQTVGDADEATWNAAAGTYVLSAGQTSISVTVEALVAGISGNVIAGQLTQFGSSVPGIDQVTNPSPITNGVEAESDIAFRARFVLYLATLAQATRAAVLAAAQGVQQGVMVNLQENIQPGGKTLMGAFTAIIDDGSGNPPNALISAVYNAVYAARAFSVQPFVIPPTGLTATISLAVRLAAGYAAETVNAAVQNAVAAMVNALGPGDTLFAYAVMTAAGSVPGVVAVSPTSVGISGGTPDLVPQAAQEVRTNVQSITVLNY